MGTSANSEQLLAIEHSGGVLLKAGAGSGKTFVLKEHVCYLTECWIKEFKQQATVESLKDFLSQRYRQVALMTFTKKAAGELAIRIKKEFELRAQDGDEWILALEAFDNLAVTTIHGFCFKLIREGFFPEVSSKLELIDNASLFQKIENLVKIWMERAERSLLFRQDRRKILEMFFKVFSDPSLRLSWSRLKKSEDFIALSEKELGDLLALQTFFDLRENIPDLGSEFEGKKWADFLEEVIQNLIKMPNFDTQSLLEWNRFFEKLEYKTPRTPSGKGVPDEIKLFYKQVKSLNDFLKANGEGIELFFSRFEEHIKPWFLEVKSAFDFVNERYFDSAGISFADLEYIVYEQLENDSVRDAIFDRYRYLIIDEFQDTSYIQFEIVSRIIKNDFSRLFCVGDAKQAIYGFRGGELGVFQECQEKIPLVLNLDNNYRSDKGVIAFNNVIFENIFEKGLGFEGHEENSVQVDYQKAPILERKEGTVQSLRASLEELSTDAVTSRDIELIEAKRIFVNILKSDAKEIAILYKKLKPSSFLMELFIREGVSFTAQTKVHFLEDPVIAIFYHLLENDINKEQNSFDYLLFSLESLFQILAIKYEKEILLEELKNFKEGIEFFGLYFSFFRFLGQVGISNSNYTNNLSYIESLCQVFSEDLELILQELKGKSSENYSLSFQFGDNPERIQIMSAHASKGLEFEEVYVGGIYTNSKSFVETSIFGKYPLSFKWSLGDSLKERYKTPQFLLENEIEKRKDFSESKRLFYVANTRAVNNLYWVDINFAGLKFTKQANSWAQGLNSWKEDFAEKTKDYISESDVYNMRDEDLQINIKQKPLFHLDSNAIASDKSKDFIIVPELSVTRLALVHDCPRKFYLKNILRLEKVEEKRESPTEEDILYDKSILYGSERGTIIHDELSRVIESDLNTDIENLSYLDSYSWIVEKLRGYLDNYDFISEKPIKFDLFGHMISGIPDLIIQAQDNKNITEIWDFKTGKSKDAADSSYHFQLYTYAYALYVTGKVTFDKPIKLVLCYVDEEKMLEFDTQFEFVEKYLRTHWKHVNRPDLKNKASCEHCPYNNICE